MLTGHIIRETMRRFIVPILLLAGIAFSGAAVVAWTQTRGVRVTVINSGPEPIADVVVHVTGNEHRIGGLAVGESRTVRVRPRGKSHVELAFVDHLGHPHHLDAGGYFNSGSFRGTIEVELEQGEIKRNGHNIELSWF
jgi:hypothetical protein